MLLATWLNPPKYSCHSSCHTVICYEQYTIQPEFNLFKLDLFVHTLSNHMMISALFSEYKLAVSFTINTRCQFKSGFKDNGGYLFSLCLFLSLFSSLLGQDQRDVHAVSDLLLLPLTTTSQQPLPIWRLVMKSSMRLPVSHRDHIIMLRM